ncbi:hypothetical protein [Desulforhabdus sp. TSK]|uniref:alpha-2-macroglobulin family protein n=1 Tax=Desulforhabdus sp. TSK TaxID=2925014 RepID=UPI001FC8D1BB|nr:hypothetical protein [Desulforhabdus sp. TSK]
MAGVPVRFQTQYKVTRGARVKGAGDAYLAEFQHTWEDEERLEGVSAVEPVELQFTPRHAGILRLTASIEDTQGRTHKTVLQRWVTGRGPVLWESIPGNLLDVYPEKSDYRVGETARFLVQNPFPGGKALITVERFGVIQRWVKTFETHSEIVEIPVRPDHLPGFYLSVMVTAPQVEKPLGPGGEDLGKPTYRMGYVRVPVDDPHKEIAVDIRPEQEVYKPRDTVRVNLDARARNLAPGEAPPPVELAVAVLDESVFDLLHERFFVVLEDPVPGGLEPVNRDLATASREDAQAGEPGYAAGSYRNRFPDWLEEAASRWSFYHRELRHDAVRFYSERLPAGRYHLSYTAQAVSPGEFQVLPVHAEEMYAPEVFGKGAPAVLKVEER